MAALVLVAASACRSERTSSGAALDAGSSAKGAASPPALPAPPTERPDFNPDETAFAPIASRPPDAGAPSGDGAEWIAFIRETDEGKTRQVMLIRPDGTQERALPQPTRVAYPGAASADGRYLVGVTVEEHGDAHLEQLIVWDLKAGKSSRIGPASRRTRSPSLTPDGETIVFESGAEGFSDIYRIRRDGKELKRLTSNPEGNFDPVLSADGEWIAFVSSRDGDPEVYRMRLDGTEQERLTAFHREDIRPVWSPRGDQLAFLSNREGADAVFLMSPDGSRQRPLQPMPGESRELAWAPDGSSLLYVNRAPGQKPRVFLWEPGRGARALTDGTSVDDMPRWAPSGARFAFVSDRSGAAQLYAMPPSGGEPVRITRSAGADWLPVWIPSR